MFSLTEDLDVGGVWQPLQLDSGCPHRGRPRLLGRAALELIRANHSCLAQGPVETALLVFVLVMKFPIVLLQKLDFLIAVSVRN